MIAIARKLFIQFIVLAYLIAGNFYQLFLLNSRSGYYIEASKLCYLSLYNKYDKPANWKLYAGYTYIHKNCSVKPKSSITFTI